MKKLLYVALLGTVVLGIACGFVSCGPKPDPNTGIAITLGDFVNIGGVNWATRNVGAPNTFVDNYWDVGMFYSWNSKTAWLPTGGVPDGWPTGRPTEGTWASANDPCPAGYRMPTHADQRVLWLGNSDSDDFGLYWDAEKHGMIIHDKRRHTAMFLPAAGYREETGAVIFAGVKGLYWRTEHSGHSGWCLTFENNLPSFSNSITSNSFTDNRSALPIRCVKM
jgi:uncharacterized protein (TIGR02145 family)